MRGSKEKKTVFLSVIHLVVTAAAVLLVFLLPAFGTSRGRAVLSGEVDAVSGATVVLAQPDGKFLVLINQDFHADVEERAFWESFFTGEDAGISFTDVVCAVANGDGSALELAKSYQSQLPENQMRILPEEGTLLISRLFSGRFDIAVVSEEYLTLREAQALADKPGISALWIQGKGEENE